MENKKFNFHFDLQNILDQKYSADYFLKTTRLLSEKGVGSERTTMQFICFNRENVMISGISEVVDLLAKVLDDHDQFIVEGVPDGTIIQPDTPILKITGPYTKFAFLENIIDGILARRSSVSTNCWRVLNELPEQQNLIYMNDRNDDYVTQPGDGYAAYVAGVRNFCTKMQIAWINDPSAKVLGTIPHALIQQYHNDIRRMVSDFYDLFQQKPAVLIDYENDVVKTLNDLIPVFDLVSAVRIDTSKHVVDRSLLEDNLRGVNPKLIWLVRHWLDEHHLKHIKIVVSSGITLEQIREWKNLPIDTYGIGSYFLKRTVAVTADLVRYNDEAFAKYGRHNLPVPETWITYKLQN